MRTNFTASQKNAKKQFDGGKCQEVDKNSEYLQYLNHFMACWKFAPSKYGQAFWSFIALRAGTLFAY
ncbi:hypothetical protein IMCC14465_13440 [alpha proteobacterium IMCC14465]|uniref:Uncharacterized protein n=1 Tax=alpha proteobacterium IMCC14465 TaxID=1220535 RepID=J9DHJ3_9PROT|nr:hypothetical protein IMCC14465_13440 [alpha proteobacterium IMCC14465]